MSDWEGPAMDSDDDAELPFEQSLRDAFGAKAAEFDETADERRRGGLVVPANEPDAPDASGAFSGALAEVSPIDDVSEELIVEIGPRVEAVGIPADELIPEAAPVQIPGEVIVPGSMPAGVSAIDPMAATQALPLVADAPTQALSAVDASSPDATITASDWFRRPKVWIAAAGTALVAAAAVLALIFVAGDPLPVPGDTPVFTPVSYTHLTLPTICSV